MQRWRDKVYECLVTNKRYEVIIRDNVRQFTKERDNLNKQLQEAVEKANLYQTKNRQMELEL